MAMGTDSVARMAARWVAGDVQVLAMTRDEMRATNAQINALHREASRLASRVAAEADESGCTNMRPSGPRASRAWDLVAAAMFLNGTLPDVVTDDADTVCGCGAKATRVTRAGTPICGAVTCPTTERDHARYCADCGRYLWSGAFIVTQYDDGTTVCESCWQTRENNGGTR